MAGQPYTWQISTPNINTGKGRISSAYEKDGKNPLTTITTINPTGYVKLFPNTTSTNPYIKNIEYAIRTDGVITYQLDGKQYNSLQEIADSVAGWSGQTTQIIQSELTNKIKSSIDAYNDKNPDDKIGAPVAQQDEEEDSNNDGTVDVLNLEQINPGKKNPTFSEVFGKDTLVYPTNIRGNGQDYIKFTTIRYVPRKINKSNNQAIGVLDRDTKEKETLGNIILPIQPSITDNNSVDWNGLGINPLAMEAVNGSVNLMSGSGAQYVEGLIQRLGNTVDDNTKNAIKLYFAQKAAGVNGLLSRVSGAIVNPNLELLFQGTTLRPFNFNFRLSPRDKPEADEVKRIIRAFKQYSAAGVSENKMFITTPNVFEIEYKSGEDSHKSLNKIKTCALTSVSVDYAPDGSYMTFSDEARTMTSYSLSLQFQELEPVTTNDYVANYDEIGY